MRISALGVMFALGLSASLATAADQRGYAGGRFALTVDGKGAGYLKSATGGGIAADVVVASSGSSSVQNKHIASPKYEPLTIETVMGSSSVLSEWIDDTLTQSAQRKNVSFFDCSYDFEVVSELDLSNSLITEIGFPELNGANKAAATVTLQLSSERTQRSAGGGAACPSADAAAKQKVAAINTFRLELDGVDTKGVASIGAFTIKRPLSTDSVGVGRDVIAEPAKLEIPNLTLYVSRAMGADFEGWASDFLIKGNSSDEKEKSGAIWLADSGGKEVARLALSHVGISGLTTDPGDPSRYKVSLYVEGMRFSIGGAKAKERKAVNLAAAKVAPTSESKVVPAKATKK